MIEARRLHILRAVADHRTVTAAAAALYLTPSAVSQQLTALEQETGHRLVERGAKGVRLTPAGEILLSHTNVVLAQLERAEAELAAYSSGAAGTVTVASFATGIALVVAPAVARLAVTAPGIRIRVQDAEGDASLPMVLDRQVDVAVAVEYRGAPPADDPRLAHVPLYAEPFDAVVPVSHRLADAEEVPLAELAKDPWIGPYPGNPCHDVVVLACECGIPAPPGALFGRLPRCRRPRLGRRGRRARTPFRTARHGPHGRGGPPGRRDRAHPPGLRGRTEGSGGASADPSGAGRVGSGGPGLRPSGFS